MSTTATPTQSSTTTHVIDETDIEFFLYKELIDYVNQIKQTDTTTATTAHINQQPFTSDVEYVSVCEYMFYVESQIDNIKKMFQSANFNKVETKSLYEKLYAIYELLKKSISDRLQLAFDRIEKQKQTESDGGNKSEEYVYLPRLVRLTQRLELTEKERLAFSYIVISQCGTHFPSVDPTSLSVASSMGRCCEMNMKELLEFLAPSRLHNKQGLVDLDAQYKDTLSGGIVKMPKECMHALIGSNLSAADFLKIDKTALSEVLLAEPGFSIQGITDDAIIENEDDYNDVDEEETELDQELQAIDEELKNNGVDLENGNDFDLYDYLRVESGTKESETKVQSQKSGEGSEEQFLSPYKNDIEYLDDRFQFLASRVKVRNMEIEKKEQESDVGMKYSRERSTDSILRELHAKERMLKGKCEKRLTLPSKFVPRLEKLAKVRNLDDFEKWVLVLLVSSVISHDVTIAMNQSYTSPKDMSVGTILWYLCGNLEERLAYRSYFYKKSTLVKDGMIRVSDQLAGDLNECIVNIDRRMLDYISGLDSEFSEIVEGSHLYFPQVKLENVILPEEQKKLIIETVSNFDTYRQYRKKLGFDEIISYGSSITLLFYGESGTGKTMMANALAHHLNKKLLLINFSTLGTRAGELLKFIFREAKINDALLFFDECESFFESRKKANSTEVTSLLTEIEKHDGLIIMATNRAYDLDEAMHRRITLSLEFRSPDPLLRCVIWKKHFPEGIELADDIDFEKLSMNYELTGGLIKNAVLAALSFAVARNGKNPIIQELDLERAAKIQIQGIMHMNEFDRRIIPTRGLSDLILPKPLMKTIEEIISFEKARKILVGQWGFDERGSKQSMTILLTGPPGTGKSLTAEAIGYECGHPLKIIDVSEVISKYAYSSARNLDTLFRETKKTGAILVIELSVNDPQKLEKSIGLFSSLEQYNGIVIMITNLEDLLNDPIYRKFKFVLDFPMPSVDLRKILWRRLIPAKVPLADDVKLDSLAIEFEFSGAQIENCIFRACSRAAVTRSDNFVTHKLLRDACNEEMVGVKRANKSIYH